MSTDDLKMPEGLSDKGKAAYETIMTFLKEKKAAPKCCAAELYARAAGKPWGERPTLDDATKPLPVGWTTRGMVQA